MKIGELFIALGFKVQGDEQLATAERNMQRATVKAAGLAVAVNAINYAFLRMVNSAREAAVEFKNFTMATGLSADELKRWQLAAEINDVSGKEMAETIKSIQSQATEIRLGRGNIAPFQLLGISPTQDPFTILKQLRQRILELPPDIARSLAAQMGISDAVFQMLRSANLEFDKLEQKYRLTQREQTSLISLNRVWKDLIFSVASLRDKFAASFAPALTMVAKGLKIVVDLLARLVQWMAKGSITAKILQVGLILLAGATGFLGVALAALAALLATITAMMVALNLAAFPIVLAITGIAAAVGILLALLASLVLVIQDFWTAIDGGKSFFDWNQNLIMSVRNVERLAKGLEKLIDWYQKLKTLGRDAGLLYLTSTASLAASTADRFSRGASSVRQENNVKVMVDGARSPEETAQAVADSISTEISDAGYQMPVPNY